MVLLVIALTLQTVAEPEAPLSVARVRARLAQPAALQIVLREVPRPIFRLEVRGHRYWTDEPQVWNFSTPPMSPLLPPQSIGESGIGATGGGGGVEVLSAIAAVRRSLKERAARREVQKALAEFCALHECS
jgi:hypothetical protein